MISCELKDTSTRHVGCNVVVLSKLLLGAQNLGVEVLLVDFRDDVLRKDHIWGLMHTLKT